MKHSTIIVTTFLSLAVSAIGMGQKNIAKKPHDNEKGVKIVPVKHQCIKFIDAGGKSIKTISIESKKTILSNEGENVVYKVKAFNGFSLSADSSYIALLFTDYKTVSTPEGSEPYDAKQRVDYYNKKGRLLWTFNDVASCAVSPEGDIVILYKQLMSKQSNLYDDPEHNDPEHMEKLVFVDSLGYIKYEVNANYFQSFNFIPDHPRFIAVSFKPTFESDRNTGYIDILRGRRYLLPKEYQSHHTVRISDDGLLFIESWNRPGFVVKTVKPEDWR